MIAKYENKAILGAENVSAHKYQNLVNLPHWHMEHELIFVERKGAEITVGNTVFMLKENQCVFVSSGDIHYVKGEVDSEILVMKIDADFVRANFGKLTLASPLLENKHKVSEAFYEICAEKAGHGDYMSIVCDSIILKLLARIYRAEKTEILLQKNTKSDAKYKGLLELISTSYASLTFDEAAQFMCLSKPYFSKYFHRLTGLTFTDYINIVRINAALRMINETDLTITLIAMQTGFGTIRNFNRVFKSITGYSPKSFPNDKVAVTTIESPEGFDPTQSAIVLI